jgi:hypothetical protein
MKGDVKNENHHSATRLTLLGAIPAEIVSFVFSKTFARISATHSCGHMSWFMQYGVMLLASE